MSREKGRFRLRMTLFLSVISITYLYPLFYMLTRSVLAYEPGLVKNQGVAAAFTLDNYRVILGGAGFLTYTANSLIVLAAVLSANLLLAPIVAFAFARYRFPCKSFLFTGILVTLMIPKQTLMVPILNLSVKLGMHDTLWALILPFCVDGFNIFILRQYIRSLPLELEDAARADGASELQILRHVVFPMCKPVLAVVAVNTAIVTWNSFLFPLILTDSVDKRTLPVGLAMFTQGPYATDWGALMAGASVASLPLIVLFWIFQKEIIAGMTAGALKD